MSQAWIIASGKGGVGKSVVTAALSMALAQRSIQTVAMDGDIGLRCLDMLFGMHNKVVYDIQDVSEKDCKLRDALITHAKYPMLSLLPAAQLCMPGDVSQKAMRRVVEKLKKRFAYVLIDAPAGIDRGLTGLLPAADHTLLIATPDDISIRDAERAASVVQKAGKPRPMLIVNRVNASLVKAGDMYSPQTVAEVLDIPLLGYIPEDPRVTAATHRHVTPMEEPGPANQAIERIARRFIGEFVELPPLEKKRFSWFRK